MQELELYSHPWRASEVCGDDKLDGDLLVRALEIPSRYLEQYHPQSGHTRDR